MIWCKSPFHYGIVPAAKSILMDCGQIAGRGMHEEVLAPKGLLLCSIVLSDILFEMSCLVFGQDIFFSICMQIFSIDFQLQSKSSDRNGDALITH